MPDHEAEVRRLALGERVPASAALAATLDALGLTWSEDGDHLRLESALELLDSKKLQAAVAAASEGVAVEVHWAIPSTNTLLMERMGSGRVHGQVCLAEQQTAGRGRRGRQWISPFGRNLYMSVAWEFAGGPAALNGLSLVVGMVIAETLRAAGVPGVGLKWPNDLLLDGGKLGGILLEMGSPGPGGVTVVVGVGINLSLGIGDAARIDQPFSTLGDAVTLSRNALAARLLSGLIDMLGEYGRHGFAHFVARWSDYDVYAGKTVTLLLGERAISGRHAGVDATGQLLLETAQGVQAYNAGEVSLRPGDRPADSR